MLRRVQHLLLAVALLPLAAATLPLVSPRSLQILHFIVVIAGLNWCWHAVVPAGSVADGHPAQRSRWLRYRAAPLIACSNFAMGNVFAVMTVASGTNGWDGVFVAG